jgi:hypothetical protein
MEAAQKVSIAMVNFDITDLDGCAVAGVQRQGMFWRESRITMRRETRCWFILNLRLSVGVRENVNFRKEEGQTSDVLISRLGHWDCAFCRDISNCNWRYLLRHYDIGEHLGQNLCRCWHVPPATGIQPTRLLVEPAKDTKSFLSHKQSSQSSQPKSDHTVLSEKTKIKSPCLIWSMPFASWATSTPT